MVGQLAGTDPGRVASLTVPREITNDLRRFFDRTYVHLLERRPRCAPVLTSLGTMS